MSLAALSVSPLALAKSSLRAVATAREGPGQSILLSLTLENAGEKPVSVLMVEVPGKGMLKAVQAAGRVAGPASSLCRIPRPDPGALPGICYPAGSSAAGRARRFSPGSGGAAERAGAGNLPIGGGGRKAAEWFGLSALAASALALWMHSVTNPPGRDPDCVRRFFQGAAPRSVQSFLDREAPQMNLEERDQLFAELYWCHRRAPP